MKNYSRAYNRHKKHVKFLRRVKQWLNQENSLTSQNIKDALAGKTFIFLRTTANPCNCSSCTYKKYKRPLKSEIKKLINDVVSVAEL